jgi:hypothetical protein
VWKWDRHDCFFRRFVWGAKRTAHRDVNSSRPRLRWGHQHEGRLRTYKCQSVPVERPSYRASAEPDGAVRDEGTGAMEKASFTDIMVGLCASCQVYCHHFWQFAASGTNAFGRTRFVSLPVIRALCHTRQPAAGRRRREVRIFPEAHESPGWLTTGTRR